MSLQLGVPLLLAMALLQATVLPHLRVFGGQPDLVLLVVIAWAILDHEREGMAWAFVGGLFLDLFSGAPLGLSSLVLLLVSFVVGFTEARLYRQSLILPILLTVAGALAYHLLYLLSLRLVSGFPVAWLDALRYVTLPSITFDAILIVPFLRVLDRLYHALHRRQVTL